MANEQTTCHRRATAIDIFRFHRSRDLHHESHCVRTGCVGVAVWIRIRFEAAEKCNCTGRDGEKFPLLGDINEIKWGSQWWPLEERIPLRRRLHLDDSAALCRRHQPVEDSEPPAAETLILQLLFVLHHNESAAPMKLILRTHQALSISGVTWSWWGTHCRSGLLCTFWERRLQANREQA